MQLTHPAAWEKVAGVTCSNVCLVLLICERVFIDITINILSDDKQHDMHSVRQVVSDLVVGPNGSTNSPEADALAPGLTQRTQRMIIGIDRCAVAVVELLCRTPNSAPPWRP